MADDSSDSVALGDVVIIGGGCYGSFYTRQLLRARERGKACWTRLLVVDRDAACQVSREAELAESCQLVTEEWGRFFDEYLGNSPDSAGPPHAIVPSPLMPHLMYEWLVRRARARWPGRPIESRSVPVGPGTPYDVLHADGTRYVSYADWLCPTHCIEPAICPVIRAPRTWEMTDAMERLSAAIGAAGPALFVCRHRVHGVGMFDVAAVRAGDALVEQAGLAPETDVLVGTISACHGAASLLHLGRSH
ncbi:MAG TPA: hypothetical protein VIG08_05835 [Gemmatimonadales bacterium]|jgi:hypothetical protein